MNLDKLREVIKEEVTKTLTEAMTRKDFVMMAKEIRKASPQHRAVLTAFAIVLGKNQNPQFNVERFKDAIAKPGKL